jgi:hypothetical protein
MNGSTNLKDMKQNNIVENENLENEWCVVWESRYAHFIDITFKVSTEYKIFYSKIKNKYHLWTAGFKPKTHDGYKIAIDKMNDFIENGHN